MIEISKTKIGDSRAESIWLSTVKRNWRSFFILFALIADSLALLVSQLIAGYIVTEWGRGPSTGLPPALPPVLLFWSVFIFIGVFVGLYRAAYHTKLSQQYALAWKAYFYSAIFVAAILFFARQFEYSRAAILLFLVLLPPFFFLLRELLNALDRLLRRLGFGMFDALIVEFNHRFNEVLFNRFQSFPELGYRIRGHFRRKKGLGKRAASIDMTKLVETVQAKRIDCIFIPTLDIIENGYSQLVSFCQHNRMKLKLLSRESDDLLRFVYITDIAGIPLSSPNRRKIEFVKKAIKRLFDLVMASLLLLMLLPVFLIVAAAILIEDGHPVLFRQKRALVLGGKSFTFLKFRSMQKGAHARQDEMYAANERSGGLFLHRSDPRLTNVGRFIRKFSIDELPQLLNVFVGHMSLVGPRPLTFGDLENITHENKMGGYYQLRSKAKPGMTGLWQICGRREVGFREMVLLDLYYIENQSILFDLEILVQTVPVVLLGKGAY